MRNLTLALLAAAALAPAASGQSAATPENNVLVVMVDDFGVDHMATYGSEKPAKTPTIDALAKNGVRFENAWVYALCTPTRAALMTGRYGFRTGVGHLGFGARRRGRSSTRLEPEEVTLPEVLDLGESGYAHGLIGKWHLGNGEGGRGPNQVGWSHFAGLLPGTVGRRSDYYDWPRTVNGKTERCSVYTTTQMTDDALAWIRSVDKPWVCVVNYNAPHAPFEEPPAHLHTEDPSIDLERDRFRCYQAMVEAVDTELGRLLESLGDARARTTVIFLGDNGTPRSVAQARSAKGSAYEGGIHVPLIVSGPSVRAPGRSSSALVSIVDLYATVAELAGVNARAIVPQGTVLDGVSFVPHLSDPKAPPVRTTMMSELFTGAPEASGFVTCRDARYKLIRSFGGGGFFGGRRGRRSRGRGRGDSEQPRDELFDLREDPGERVNLLDGELTGEQRAAHEALLAALRKLNRKSG